MQKKISSTPFRGTAEQEAQLRSVIAANKHDKSRLMAVMQEAQGIYGYLPLEVQNMIAEGMEVPLEKVFGVATFYAQFSLTQKGETHIAVCLGTACYVKGSGTIYAELQNQLGIAGDECTADGRFSLTASRCIGACGLAPVMTVNDEVYGRLTKDDVAGILEKYGK
ncbi:MAG: NAD(P)H-dependent oxidoreductase subunit E [Eubacteriales bacterium]